MYGINPYYFLKKIWVKTQATRSVSINQRDIDEISNLNSSIFLEPIPPLECGGYVEHYYHFIFDLVFPLYFLTRNNPNTTFLLNSFGIYTTRIQYLFPDRIQIEDRAKIPEEIPKTKLIGMNPKSVRLKESDLQSFSEYICEKLGIDRTQPSNKILLIERVPPDPYFLTEARSKGGGSSRRSILNHEDLAFALRSIAKEPFEFHNLQLENIPLEQQVEYFYHARIVIAQHGAGLANCIWMQPGAIVIELSNDKSLQHFQIISQLKNHHYYRYKTTGNQTQIDIDRFNKWILGNSKVKALFSRSMSSRSAG